MMSLTCPELRWSQAQLQELERVLNDKERIVVALQKEVRTPGILPGRVHGWPRVEPSSRFRGQGS